MQLPQAVHRCRLSDHLEIGVLSWGVSSLFWNVGRQDHSGGWRAAADPGGGFVGFGRTPLRPGVVVENARTACSEADPFPFCDF